MKTPLAVDYSELILNNKADKYLSLKNTHYFFICGVNWCRNQYNISCVRSLILLRIKKLDLLYSRQLHLIRGEIVSPKNRFISIIP